MSCMMLQDSTIALLADFLYEQIQYPKHNTIFIKPDDMRVLASACNPYTREELRRNWPIQADSLFRAMKALNLAAYHGRYPDTGTPDAITIETPAPKVLSFNVPKAAILKRFDCFLYQCSEQANDNVPLLPTLERCRDALALVIARSLPEYDAAPWG